MSSLGNQQLHTLEFDKFVGFSHSSVTEPTAASHMANIKLVSCALLNSSPWTYPFVSDDLIGFLLQLVKTESTNGVGVLNGLGLLTGCGWTSAETCGSDVIEV